MFLNMLSQEEKEAFLKLAYLVAKSDEEVSNQEEELINIYCTEMNIENKDIDLETLSLEEILDDFKSPISQKIVLIEILALIYSDEILHQNEQEIIDRIAEKFNISSTLLLIYQEWAKAMLALSKQGKLLLEL